MKRIGQSLRMAIAAAALVSVGAAGCATKASGASPKSTPTPRESTSPKPAPTAAAGFAGYKWQVVAIEHDGKETPVPGRYNVYLTFTPNGQFLANEPVNSHSGTYRDTADGFTTSDVGTTLVLYVGKNPVVLLSINAISAFDNGVHATAKLTGDRLAVTVGGYLLTCQRDGKQVNFPTGGTSSPAKPSATAHAG